MTINRSAPSSERAEVPDRFGLLEFLGKAEVCPGRYVPNLHSVVVPYQAGTLHVMKGK